MWDAVSLLLRTAKTGNAAVARLAGLAPRWVPPDLLGYGHGTTDCCSVAAWQGA